MDDLQQQLSAVMNNPAMMQQIMQLAQNMEQPDQPQQSADPQASSAQMLPDIDLSMIQKLSGFAKHSSIDPNQKALLSALRPYLNGHRIGKLERAMKAAKMAGLATSLIGR